ncbi:MAG: hypothetical protein JWM33_2953 [Caulobacteraceae bacterium]|nr:hypothetical protein [Caulobacteraceae bacterium]
MSNRWRIPLLTGAFVLLLAAISGLWVITSKPGETPTLADGFFTLGALLAWGSAIKRWTKVAKLRRGLARPGQ